MNFIGHVLSKDGIIAKRVMTGKVQGKSREKQQQLGNEELAQQYKLSSMYIKSTRLGAFECRRLIKYIIIF